MAVLSGYLPAVNVSVSPILLMFPLIFSFSSFRFVIDLHNLRDSGAYDTLGEKSPNMYVTDVQVACSTNSYAVEGNVSGLSGTLALQNNGCNDLYFSSLREMKRCGSTVRTENKKPYISANHYRKSSKKEIFKRIFDKDGICVHQFV